nr:RNA-guided endonuclease TnpB family protein [Actinokineospora xionganensis]
MLVRYRYRIEPSAVQRSMMARTFGCCRVVFNDVLRTREHAYSVGEKVTPAEVQRRVITQARTTEARAWLAEVVSVALVQSVQDAHRAYSNFFASAAGSHKGRVGKPRFKSRKDNRQSFRLTRNGFHIRSDGRLYLAKVGDIRVRWSRGLPSQPSSVTIIREPDGHYYASFVVDVAPIPLPEIAREAGVDLGITRLATVADTEGQRVDVANPKHLARKQRKLARLEREKARRAKYRCESVEVAAEGSRATWQGLSSPTRLSAQTSSSTGPRQPSGLRGGLEHRRTRSQPQVGPGYPRRWMGSVRRADRGEGQALRPDCREGIPMAAQLENVCRLRPCH